jgi:hypothetical protein
MLDSKYLEELADNEYRDLVGKFVRVSAINGYANEACSDTFRPNMLGKPVIVCINTDEHNDRHRWMDEWLDPVYSVEIVERGDLPKDLRFCWIYGNSRSLKGDFEPGDIYAVVNNPNGEKSYVTTEAVEAYEKYMRVKGNYVRSR